jgi:hypothetical protein
MSYSTALIRIKPGVQKVIRIKSINSILLTLQWRALWVLRTLGLYMALLYGCIESESTIFHIHMHEVVFD